jgi:hypothetical protein
MSQAVVRRLRGVDIPTVAHVRPDSRVTHGASAFTARWAPRSTPRLERGRMGSMFAARRPSVIFILLGTTRQTHAAAGR